MKESDDLIYYARVVISTIRFPSNKQDKLFYDLFAWPHKMDRNGRCFSSPMIMW